MDKKIEITEWIKSLIVQPTLFFSFHFGTPPTTTDELCKRCRCVFTNLFREILGRHWHKSYTGYFTIIGVREHGKFGNMHAHFLLICKDLYNCDLLKEALLKISPKLHMDVWFEHAGDTKQYPNDVLVQSVYSLEVTNYTTKEIKINDWHMTDSLIIDTDLIY